MKMAKRQQGMTLISWILVFIVAGIFGIVGIKTVPAYLQYLSVKTTLNKVAQEANDNGWRGTEVWSSISKKLDVNNVNYIKKEHIKAGKKKNGYEIKLDYSHHVPLFANIELVVVFDHTAQSR